MNNQSDINKLLDQILHITNHDTYMLTYNDMCAIEWRLRELQKFINDTYDSKYIRNK